jgi:ligand-binding sensor domain-containing protein
MVARGEDELWVATAGAGVLRIAPDGSLRGRVRASHGLASDLVWDLASDGPDRVLAGTSAGLSVVRGARVVADAPEAAASRTLAVPDVRAVARGANALWLGTFGAGPYRARGATSEPAGGPSVARRIRALAAGDGGAIYLAHEGGLDLLRAGAREPVSVLSGGLPSGDVTAIAEALGALWIATFDRGLARVENGVARAVTEATARWGMDPRVNDLAVTRDAAARQTLWIATDGGLYAHDGRSFVPAGGASAPSAPDHVTALHVDPRTGDLWVASTHALSRLRGGAWTAWRGGAGVPLVQLDAVTTDAQGRAWVGGLHGLFRLDEAAGRFERYTVSSGALPVDWVTSVSAWEGGVVAGTYHGGLAWYDGTRFRIEREGRRLPSGWVNVHATRAFAGALWAGTLERGLLVGRAGAWERLGRGEGLPCDDVTAILPSADRNAAWVATRAGLARIVWD